MAEASFTTTPDALLRRFLRPLLRRFRPSRQRRDRPVRQAGFSGLMGADR